MKLPVAWPRVIREKIESWDLSPEEQMGLIETLNSRINAVAEPSGFFCLEYSFIHDFYVWAKYERDETHIVVIEGDLQWIGFP